MHKMGKKRKHAQCKMGGKRNGYCKQKLNTKSVFSLNGFICVVVCSLVLNLTGFCFSSLKDFERRLDPLYFQPWSLAWHRQHPNDVMPQAPGAILLHPCQNSRGHFTCQCPAWASMAVERPFRPRVWNLRPTTC